MGAMQLTPITAEEAATELVDLLCDDVAWVRAEFDAIVACSWPSQPADTGTGSRLDRVWPRDVPPPVTTEPVERGSSRPGSDGWARQRSPPCERPR